MHIDPTDGLPLVGSSKGCLLGVRPTGTHADVDLHPAGDVNGNVISNDKGLSVVDDWRKLAGYQIPQHLDDGHNGASGRNMHVFVHGTGPFSAGAVAAGLEMILKQGRLDRGVIRPVATVPLAAYKADLQATRPNWVVDES
jgi:hypothetical protein